MAIPDIDLRLISGLTGLTDLSIDGLTATNLDADCGAAPCRALDLRGARVDDYSALARLTGLTTLGLSQSNIVDISPLAMLPELQTLGLFDTPVADISPLAKNVKLDLLYLDGTRITDISPCAIW